MTRAGQGGRRPVVAVGGRVRFRGARWQVVALSGQHVHLAGEDGANEAVLAGHLFADPGFAVLGEDGGRAQAVPQWGLFETAPAAAREKALAWQRHIREVESGNPGGNGGGTGANGGVVRAEYDPALRTLAEREQAKAAELTALGFGRVSRATVQRMRGRYRRQGLWGLVDQRTTRGADGALRTDERVTAAIADVLRARRGRSKGTVSGLMPAVAHLLKDRHRGAVAMPSRATFYRLVDQLAHPADHPGKPVRNPPVTEDGHRLVPTVALRPGEQVQVDTTRLDVLAVFEDGSVGRPELTIAVDVATRAILAAVLCPGGTQAVDAALLLAEVAVPRPARPTWPEVLRFDRSRVLPHRRLTALDERLAGAAARPVAVPETIVVDRGKVFVSRAFTAACEALGISVQPAPPFAPTAKGIVERTFGSINSLFCQHLPGYTGPNVTRRGRDAEREACLSVPELQDLLDEWLVHWHHRPHEGLRHPVMPKAALTPNQMWAALVAAAGYVPVPLGRSDYLELLPVRWHAITERGIRLHHRTYDHDLLAPYRGQASPVTARGGKWEVHTNPHDARQIWVRLPGCGLTEIPWIHRDHAHHPFSERVWEHLRTTATGTGTGTGTGALHGAGGDHTHSDRVEADLADALDHLVRRARTGHATALPAPPHPSHRRAPGTARTHPTTAKPPRARTRTASTNSTTGPTRPSWGRIPTMVPTPPPGRGPGPDSGSTTPKRKPCNGEHRPAAARRRPGNACQGAGTRCARHHVRGPGVRGHSRRGVAGDDLAGLAVLRRHTARGAARPPPATRRAAGRNASPTTRRSSRSTPRPSTPSRPPCGP
ncbi:DDE-type integrase/transposase/recombinase [Yinghuangia sp. KLBMP8922]|uniref:DDE-type integrase/transposase/recombinase n=1 Tax=Yinghuangia soli TaxID=2908204 RepID=A0AA41U3X0_9ACTN|nr:DDE-type integrase/transposase/recombinase [Yinghuangia soli]